MALPASINESGFKGDTNLVEAFQDRGTDFDRVRDFTQSGEFRVLFVTGGRGIGKTDFLNAVFQKNLRDWKVIRVPIARGSRVARVVADIAYEVGVQLDIDSLAAAAYPVFAQKVKKILAQFFSQARRALIVDDLHDLLEDASGRDYRHFEILIQEARTHQGIGGRVIFVSSSWVKSQWINAKGVYHLPLRDLPDMYIRRVIEYQLRLKGAVSGEAPPSIPQSLLDLVRGHALSARLLADVAAERGLDGLADDLDGITEHLASELLKQVKLAQGQKDALTRLSVYRLPIRADLLADEEIGLGRQSLVDLARGALLNYDGKLFTMHEAVRRYYYGKMSSDARQVHHRFAISYYERERIELERRGTYNPGISAEIAHHAVMTGDPALTAKLRDIVVEELKPGARRIYREERDYQRALKLYRVIADIVPDDVEVIAYLGRCYARLRLWDESDMAFGRAVNIAARRGEDWWVYRDWGHIRARYGFYAKALECFQCAERKIGKESSICAALAYMHWREGDSEHARELFEEALLLNPNHGYALTYFARLLDESGEYARARALRERLKIVEVGATPNDHDIEVEIDDL